MSSLIPKKYSSYFTDEVEGHLLVWQPTSNFGLSVLNPESAFIFNLIDGNKSCEDLLVECKQVDDSVDLFMLEKILDDLETAQIIYWKKPEIIKLMIDDPRVLGVWLHTTNQCNLRCDYCYVHKTTAHLDLTKGKHIVSRILENAKEHGFKIVKFKYSGGEVMLRFNQAMALVNHAKNVASKLGLDTIQVFLTNGVLLTRDKVQMIKEAGIKVMISLDGSEYYHNCQRTFPSGAGSFAYVWRAIQLLKEFEISFNVSLTVTEKNVEGIPEITQKMLDEEIPFVFNFFRENCEAGSELMTKDKQLIEVMKKTYGIIEQSMPKHSIIGGLLDRVSVGLPRLNACGVGRNYLVVDQDGKMASCQVELGRKIGSIDDDDPIQVMIDNNFMQPTGLTVDQKMPCKDCLWRYACGGGCPLLTHSVKGRYDTNTPYCNVYRELIPDLLRLEAKRLIRNNNLMSN